MTLSIHSRSSPETLDRRLEQQWQGEVGKRGEQHQPDGEDHLLAVGTEEPEQAADDTGIVRLAEHLVFVGVANLSH